MTRSRKLVYSLLIAVSVTFAIFGLLLSMTVKAARADASVPEIHYAPAENLERIDVALIDRASRSIDMAAYVLTDYPVIEALTRAARRGVAVRILLDRGQQTGRDPSEPFKLLQAAPGVVIRIKVSRTYMHLKSYAVDGRWLRSGAANLSASGLKRQDNDLVLFDSAELAAGFTRTFEAIFAQGAQP